MLDMLAEFLGLLFQNVARVPSALRTLRTSKGQVDVPLDRWVTGAARGICPLRLRTLPVPYPPPTLVSVTDADVLWLSCLGTYASVRQKGHVFPFSKAVRSCPLSLSPPPCVV